MAVDPNPAEAGAIVTLSVSTDEPPHTYIGGASATWQCWDGVAWVDTHLVLRDGYGGSDPLALELTPGAEIAVSAVGLPVPNSYPIRIPMVSPGIYRIIDQVGGAGGRLGGHVIVVVR